MRRKAILLAVVLVAAGCGREGAVETTTTMEVAAASTEVTTTIAPEAAATTVPDGPTLLTAGRTVLLESGTAYASGGFVLPFSFRVDDDGWRWYGVAEDWAYLGWVSDGEVAAAVAILGYRTSLAPAEIVEAVESIEGVDVVAGPSDTVVGAFDGLSIDVEGAPERAQVGIGSQPCTDGVARFFTDEAGYALVEDPANPFEYGVAACKVSRLWVVDANGQSITLIGGATDPGRFDEVIPVVERLVDSMSFEAP